MVNGDDPPYSARLAIITAIRQHYAPRALVFPADAGDWLSDESWQRVVLDSFDRTDWLGDTAKRTLRIMKSPRSKDVLDATLAQLALEGSPQLGLCLDLAQKKYDCSAANNLISNLKKNPFLKLSRAAVQARAIQESTSHIFSSVNMDNLPDWTIVPIPPSKQNTDPASDDRL